MKLDFESRRVNLAVLKPVKMSSMQGHFKASRAVDGSRESLNGLTSCSATRVKTTKSWWRVDLEGIYIITDVIITNAGNNYGE